MKKIPFLRTVKMIFLGCFLAGFVLFLILGKTFLDDNLLLHVGALREIKDSTIDKDAFFRYIAWRRLLLVGVCLWLWWKGFGKWVIYASLGWIGAAMGACMYTCLFRYHFKGIFLWIFLYFPHLLCYAAALFCGMILTVGKIPNKAEKIKFLWQHWLFVLGFGVAVLLGMYAESYINVSMLQDFLQFF